MTQTGRASYKSYAAVFNSLSEDLGGWREQIAPGAFKRSLQDGADVRALSEHDPQKGILGRTKANTLRLAEDNFGLRFEIDLPNTSLGNDVATSIARGDLDGMSFGFHARDTDWADGAQGIVRTLKDVELLEVTITALPAYTQTSVALRSLFPDGKVEIPPELKKAETRDAMDKEDSLDEGCECDCSACRRKRATARTATGVTSTSADATRCGPACCRPS